MRSALVWLVLALSTALMACASVPATGVSAEAGQEWLTESDEPETRRRARLRVEVHAHHFATQPAFTQAFGEGATDQPQADHHQATDHRHSRLQCSDINHGPEPWPAPQGSGCSPRANRW